MFEVKELTKIDKVHNKKIYVERLKVSEQDCLGVIFKDKFAKDLILECFANLIKWDTGTSSLHRSEIFWIDSDASLLNSKNVYENISLALELKNFSRAEIKEKIKTIARFFAIEDKLDYKINDINQLTKKKVKLAQALVCNPKLIVINDLTAHLVNIKEKIEITKVIQKIIATYKVPFIIASNDEYLIKNCCNKVTAIQTDGTLEHYSAMQEFFTTPKDALSREYLKFCAIKNLPIQIKAYMQQDFTQLKDDDAAIICVKFNHQSFDVNEQFGKLIKLLECKVDIILAVNDVIQDNKIGNIYFKFTTKSSIKDNLDELIKFFHQQSVFAEALGYVSTNV